MALTKQQIESLSKLLGRRELAAQLKVTEAMLDSWVFGVEQIPERHLRALVELALKHNVLDEYRAADTYRATLVRAAEILGGAVPLSRRLQVPMPDITRWLAGAERPGMGTFLKVIDILIEENRSPAEQQQVRADRSQAQADRSQARADRDQAKAERDQAKAEREQKRARRMPDDAGKTAQPSRPRTEHFRQVQPEDSEPASNAPDDESGKSTG